jgi:hypothetical protein
VKVEVDVEVEVEVDMVFIHNFVQFIQIKGTAREDVQYTQAITVSKNNCISNGIILQL